ncbi:MAG: hypothetical protein AABZ80_00975 [Gemmatimonadota bacterium]
MAAAVLSLAGPCVALACNATGPKLPKEETLTIRTLFSGPASPGNAGMGPEIDLIPGKFVLRRSYFYGSSDYLLSAALVRRGLDTLLVEVRARRSDSPGLATIWQHDYEAESPATTPGSYHLSWWHVEQTLNKRTLILDTSIVIPASP